MQQSNPLIGFLCLVALVAFGTSAILLVMLIRRGNRAAPRAPLHADAVPLMPAPTSPPPASVQAIQPPALAPGAALPYAAIPTLLTHAEQHFFAMLQAAVPDGLLICPQVRLANLVRPTARKPQQKKYDFYRIQAKCVDFVLCDRATTAPRQVIELDDASHARPDRQARDAFVDAVLATVRLPVLHVRWQRSYDATQLAAAIRHALGDLRVATPPSAARNQSRVTPANPLPDDWARPIVVEPRAGVLNTPTHGLLTHTPRYVCGTCQAEVPRDSLYCTQCGTPLARA